MILIQKLLDFLAAWHGFHINARDPPVGFQQKEQPKVDADAQQDTDTVNQWDEVKELNENAVPSVLLGFTFDTSNVEDQLSNCTEVWLRYKSEVLTGVRDPKEAVPEIKEELMNAGFQDVLDEAQSQIDEFLANKQ